MQPTPTLMLSVMGQHAAQLGSRSQKAFEGRDGSMGRSEDCDWVLSASGVSRVHALIRFLNGIYFIEDRSTNGMLLNGAPLIKGDPSVLKHGDQLQIDTLEISVTLTAPVDASPLKLQPPVERFALAPLPPRAAAVDPMDAFLDLGQVASLVSGAAPDDGLIPDATPQGRTQLDPLSFFDAPFTPPDPPAPATSWNHAPGSADYFRPPITEGKRQAQQLPERWDLTMGDFAAKVPPAAATPAPIPAVAPALPEGWDLTMGDFAATVPPVADVAAAPEPMPAVPAAAILPVADGTISLAYQEPQGRVAVAPTEAPPAPAEVAAGSALSPEMQQMLNIVVDGVMDVLRARAEIKNTFRLPVTIIQRSENNPLKFAPNAEEALQKIMAPPNASFLSGPAAFNDAFDDIRCHQLAMLAGVRAAFESLLAHFGPDRLEQEVDGGKPAFFGGKARYWKKYCENFERLAKNPDESFRRLFGDEFARAYEDQLLRLKSARRGTARR